MILASRLAPGVVAAALLLACSGPTLAAPAIGSPAPDFTLSDLDGNSVALAALKGKIVVLEWANPNCPFSRRHAQAHTMQATADRHPEVVWLAINSTRPDHGDHLQPPAYRAFLAENGIRYPVLEDPSGDVGRAYGATTTPDMYVIDAAGNLAYAGAIDDDPRGRHATTNYVEAALDALAAGREPEPAATKPYGCTVKY